MWQNFPFFSLKSHAPMHFRTGGQLLNPFLGTSFTIISFELEPQNRKVLNLFLSFNQKSVPILISYYSQINSNCEMHLSFFFEKVVTH